MFSSWRLFIVVVLRSCRGCFSLLSCVQCPALLFVCLFVHFCCSCLPQKLPWLLPVAAVLAACGQYVCYFIDDATQLELELRWLSVILNICRVISLLHVLYGYILFLAIILFLMYITGSSMKEFRGKAKTISFFLEHSLHERRRDLYMFEYAPSRVKVCKKYRAWGVVQPLSEAPFLIRGPL